MEAVGTVPALATAPAASKLTFLGKLKRCYPYFKPFFLPSTWQQTRLMAVGYLIVLLRVVVNALSPLLFGASADGLLNRDYSKGLTALATSSLLTVLRGAFESARYEAERSIRRVPMRELELTLFRTALAKSYDWHIKKKSGVAERVMGDVTWAFESIFTSLVFDFVPKVLDVLTLTYVTATSSSQAGVFLAGMLLQVICSLLISKVKEAAQSEASHSSMDSYNLALESLGAVETVRSCGAEKQELQRMKEAMGKANKSSAASNVSSGLSVFFQSVITRGTVAWLLLQSAREVLEKQSTVGAFITLSTSMPNQLSRMSQLGNTFSSMSSHWKVIGDFLSMIDDQGSAVEDAPGAKPLQLLDSKKGAEVRDNKGGGGEREGREKGNDPCLNRCYLPISFAQ